MNKSLFVIIMIALVTRLLSAFLPGFKIDVDDWSAWAMRLNEVGYSKFYSNQFFSDYTPGYLYVLSFLGFLKNLLQIDAQTFSVLLKLPAIFAEISLGVFIYRELKKNLSTAYAQFAACLIFLNPALIFNSSVWGQIDSILALFVFLAIYLLEKKSLILSSILLSLACLVKPQAIAIFPIYALFILKNFSLKNFIKIALPLLFLVFLFSLPFFPNKPLTKLFNLILNTANHYPYSSLNAYNFWGILGFWINDLQKIGIFTYQQLGHLLLFSYWAILAYLYLIKKIPLYALAALATLAFYFLPTRVHERYLYPAIPFLILTAALLKSRLLWGLTGFLSLMHFFNLYNVYIYYNQFYFNLPSILYVAPLYNFLNDNGKTLSLISTLIFILINIVIIKSHATSEKN